jgi:hypothetical protein
MFVLALKPPVRLGDHAPAETGASDLHDLRFGEA